MSLGAAKIGYTLSTDPMQPGYLAHTRTDEATGHTTTHALAEHLRAVAELTAQHAAHFAPDWGHLAGLWHDLGKYRPGFQTYLRQTSEAHIEGRLPAASDKSHSAAGALHAMETFEARFGASGAKAARILAYVIAGHHAGLADWTASLDQRLLGTRGPDSQREYKEAAAACSLAEPALLVLHSGFELQRALGNVPGLAGDNPLALSLWIRLLFSALFVLFAANARAADAALLVRPFDCRAAASPTCPRLAAGHSGAVACLCHGTGRTY